VQNVVNDMGMNLHAWIIQSAIRRRAKIADARGGRTDEHDLSMKSFPPKFSLDDIGERIMRVRVTQPVIIDDHSAQLVGANLRGLSEQNAVSADRAELQNDLFIRQSKIGPHGLHIHRRVEVPIVEVFGAAVGNEKIRVPHHAVDVGIHIEESRRRR